MNEEKVWKIFATAAGVGAAIVARRLLERAWTKRRGAAPPRNPADDDTPWRDAILYAGASGLAIGLARVVSDRVAAEAWRRATGTYPPGVKHREDRARA